MQFLDKVVRGAAGVNIDKVVDVPVIMQRRSLHALSTEAFGRISTCSTCLRCSLENLELFLRALCIWQPLPTVYMRQNSETLGWTIFQRAVRMTFSFFAKVTHMHHFFVLRISPRFPGQVPIFQPSRAHTSRAPGVPESPGVLLPGDSAHVCTINDPVLST